MITEDYGSSAGAAKHILYDDVAPGFHLDYRKEPAHSHMAPHIHNAAEFYLNLSDLPYVLLGDRLRAVPAGSLILFPSSCIHRTVRTIGEIYERYVLFVNIEWYYKVMAEGAKDFAYLSDAMHPVVISLNAAQLSYLEQQLHMLLSCDNALTPGSLSIFFSLMHIIDELLKEPLREGTERCPDSYSPMIKAAVKKSVPIPQQRVNDIIAYLHEHFREDISMADLTEQFFLDADYIARIFKKYTNTTIRRYIALQRITQAGTLLKEGHAATETSRMVGYQDYSLFYRNFHQIMGVSPTEFASTEL